MSGNEFISRLSRVDVREFQRRMDWLYLAHRLANAETAARAILSYPADPRREIAQKVLDLAAQIRQQHRDGFDTGLLVSDLGCLMRSGNALVLRPLVEMGGRVRAGGRKGADIQHESVVGQAKRRVAAFLEERKTVTSDERALKMAARKLGVSARTVRRACSEAGILRQGKNS